MEKINIELTREYGNPEKNEKWGYGVKRVQGKRTFILYRNSAEIIGNGFVLKDEKKDGRIAGIFDVKTLDTKIQEIDKELYTLAYNIARKEVKRLRPELIDKTKETPNL
ncbi:MAG: hypothetical protein V1889_02565 [archaeon]